MARTNAVARAFLLWLDVNEARHPNPQEWLDTEPVIDGEPVTEAELERVAMRCVSYELIKGLKTGESRMPLRVHLLDGGRECIDDYAADPRAWRDAQRGSGATTYDQRVWITQGDYAQAVAHAQDVAQDMTLEVDPDRLADVADAAEEVAGIVSPARQAEVRAAAGELREAAKGSDEARMRTAGAALLAVLGPFANGFTVIRFIIDALSGGLGG